MNWIIIFQNSNICIKRAITSFLKLSEFPKKKRRKKGSYVLWLKLSKFINVNLLQTTFCVHFECFIGNSAFAFMLFRNIVSFKPSEHLFFHCYTVGFYCIYLKRANMNPVAVKHCIKKSYWTKKLRGFHQNLVSFWMQFFRYTCKSEHNFTLKLYFII